MNMYDMMEDQKSFHIRHLERSFEQLEERRVREPHAFVQIGIEQLQMLISELIGMHNRCDRLESWLNDYARYTFPVTQRINLNENLKKPNET